jgi:hypothetical protein
MISWNFPSNQNGQIKGVADAGIENFNGTELSSLARENCQNSLDAALDDTNPKVLVEFERYFVHDEQIPGIAEYRQILTECKVFWDTSKSEKAKTFLKNAVSYANKNSGFMLRISDYNTTGLADPYRNPGDPIGFNFDGWNALVKIDGGANKGEDKAGAFGIGKSAPFSNSCYRLVFYRTFNQKHERATQGISRLMSYPDGTAMTSGVGYYGSPEGNNPVESIPELDVLNNRTEIGTDVFVYGFKAASDWDTEITTALLENFLMSFYNGQLRVKVQGREINANTLGDYILCAHNEFPGKTKGTYGNYLALTRTEGVYTYTEDFHGLGTLELRLLVDPNEKLDRKVLIVRKAGMKLFRLGNISKLVPFTGILELRGKALNSYFRSIETVAHDNWEPGRHTDPKQAKVYYEEIKDWIRTIVSELAEHISDDEMDVEGLGGVLQKEPETVETGDSDNKRENLNNHLGQIDMVERPTKTPTKGFFYGQGDEGSREAKQTIGTLGPTGDSGLRILKGKRRRKKLDSHRGKPDSEGKDIVVEKKPGGETNCALKNVRIIKQDTGTYTVNFEIPHDVERGKIELVTVGENGKSNRIRITEAKPAAGCSAANSNGDYIEAVSISSSKKVQITVKLADSHDYAMEVNVYEHN